MDASLSEYAARIQHNISQVLLGKEQTVKMAVVAIIAEGHLLIEDVPGVGKTLLARALARSIGGSFRRIQFTPDLLPSDIVGTSIFQTANSEFKFKPGPIFANVVLADEVNRTTPRTQSALLEAMNDRQVSFDGETHRLPRPFIVLATQNPFEFEGTYALPESQLDRFMMRIRVGYPERSQELKMLVNQRNGEPIESLQRAVATEEVQQLQAAARQVRVDDELAAYILEIVEATRKSADLYIGSSPRGSINLYRAAQANALVEQRDYVVPDDIKELAVAVLGHRVIGKTFAQDGETGYSDHVIQDIIDHISVPA